MESKNCANQYCQSGTSPPADTEIVKTCTKCKNRLPIACFHKKGDRRDSRCRDCIAKVKQTKYRQKRRRKSYKSKTIDIASCELIEIIPENIDLKTVIQDFLEKVT